MSGDAAAYRIVGTLHTADGKGIVRMEDRFPTDVDDLWQALTDPDRLGRWLGEFDGELRLNGDFRARFFASGWEGSGRVDVCEPPHHLLVRTWQTGEPDEEHVIEATLSADADNTLLILEERGMPVHLLADYGAGIQVHVEDLAAEIAGGGRCDAETRWAQLKPAYEDLARRLD